jgi:hypothetical protein
VDEITCLRVPIRNEDVARELATFVQTHDHRLGDERADYGVGNGTFDARDVQDEGEGTPR